MVTPLDTDGAVDLDGAQRLAAHLVDEGNDGLVISGTTGESPTTSDREKQDLIRAVKAAVGDRATVIAGTGTNDTRHAVELSEQAEKAGAHALLLVAPYYNKPPQQGLVEHFRAIADATELPVMLYDIPGRTGVAIATESLLRLAEHDRIVAVKDAKYDIPASTRVMASTDLAYYCGMDEMNLAWLAVGAVGVVSVVAHVATPQYRAMIEAVGNGDLDTARAIDRRLIPAFRGIMTRTQGAIMAKAALQLAGVIPSRTVRPPLVAATEEQLELLRNDLTEAELV